MKVSNDSILRCDKLDLDFIGVKFDILFDLREVFWGKLFQEFNRDRQSLILLIKPQLPSLQDEIKPVQAF